MTAANNSVREFLFLLKLLFENPINAKFLAQDDLFEILCRLLVARVYEAPLESLTDCSCVVGIVDLITVASRYNLMTHQASMLLDMAMGSFIDQTRSSDDPVSSLHLQLFMLRILNDITASRDPTSYLSFDGINGYFQTVPIERFPSAKVGFSISTWIKITAFLETVYIYLTIF
jgi:hypothetical protein